MTVTSRSVPIANSYWVSEHLLAGEYPGNLDPKQAREKIVRFLEAGASVGRVWSSAATS